MWRLDRDHPANSEPEWFETQADADARLWRLKMSGYTQHAVTWEDLARYEGGAA